MPGCTYTPLCFRLLLITILVSIMSLYLPVQAEEEFVYADVKDQCFGPEFTKWINRGAYDLTGYRVGYPDLSEDEVANSARAAAIFAWAWRGGTVNVKDTRNQSGLLAECYFYGTCGLPKDLARATALQKIHHEQAETLPDDLVLPHLPPKSAYDWAKANFHGPCAEAVPSYPSKRLSELESRPYPSAALRMLTKAAVPYPISFSEETEKLCIAEDMVNWVDNGREDTTGEKLNRPGITDAERIAGIQAAAIVYWAYSGGSWVTRKSTSAVAEIEWCYRNGACGLPQDLARADALLRRIDDRSQVVPVDLELPQVPPKSAYDWAIAHYSGACGDALPQHTSLRLGLVPKGGVPPIPLTPGTITRLDGPPDASSGPKPLIKDVVEQCFRSDVIRWMDYADSDHTGQYVGYPNLSRDEIETGAKAAAIMYWAYNGAQYTVDGSASSYWIQTCFWQGDCELEENEARSRAIRMETNGYEKIPDHFKLTILPPPATYQWARENYIGPCAERFPEAMDQVGYYMPMRERRSAPQSSTAALSLPQLPDPQNSCPDRDGLKRMLSDVRENWAFELDSVKKAALRDHYAKYALLYWAEEGAWWLRRKPFDVLQIFADCYEVGACGLPVDAEAAARFRAVEGDLRVEIEFEELQLNNLPPIDAYRAARDQIPACRVLLPDELTSPLKRGQERERLERERQLAENRRFSAPDRVRVLAQEYMNGADNAAELAQWIGYLDPVRKFQMMQYGEPLYPITTNQQKALAMAAVMDYWSQPDRIAAFYGLTSYNPLFVEALMPNLPARHRENLSTVISQLKTMGGDRAERRDRQIARARFLENWSNALAQSRSQYATTNQSTPSFNYQQDAWLFGNANRPPCTVSNPCGPSSQFKAFPD